MGKGLMRTRLKLKPGQKGTKELAAIYGERLVCVRYRYDEQTKKRYKTVELIVEEIEWEPQLEPDDIVQVKVGYTEIELWQQVRRAGGKWNLEKEMWELPYQRVKLLRLEERIVRDEIEGYQVLGVAPLIWDLAGDGEDGQSVDVAVEDDDGLAALDDCPCRLCRWRSECAV
jgi:hypothetical protein